MTWRGKHLPTAPTKKHQKGENCHKPRGANIFGSFMVSNNHPNTKTQPVICKNPNAISFLCSSHLWTGIYYNFREGDGLETLCPLSVLSNTLNGFSSNQVPETFTLLLKAHRLLLSMSRTTGSLMTQPFQGSSHQPAGEQ
jgi:hypothetical protein